MGIPIVPFFTKASLLGCPFRGEASAGVAVYANEVSRGGPQPKVLKILPGAGGNGWSPHPFWCIFLDLRFLSSWWYLDPLIAPVGPFLAPSLLPSDSSWPPLACPWPPLDPLLASSRASCLLHPGFILVLSWPQTLLGPSRPSLSFKRQYKHDSQSHATS